MKAHSKFYTNNHGKKIYYYLPAGRYLARGEFTRKGDLQIWSFDKPSVYPSKLGDGWMGEIGEQITDRIVYRPFKKKAKPKINKANPTYPDMFDGVEHRTLGPDEEIKAGDIWFSNLYLDGYEIGEGNSTIGQPVKSRDWRVYKRPIKALEAGTRVSFDLTKLEELKGEGTILEIKPDTGKIVIWCDKSVLGQEAIVVDKSCLKVKG